MYYGGLQYSKQQKLSLAPSGGYWMSRVRLLDQVRNIIGVKHLSRRTARQAGKGYTYWIKRYILFHKKGHPGEMGTIEISAFLTHLAME